MNNYYKGCNRARNGIYGEVRVLSRNVDGTFVGESITTGMTLANLKESDFYFYEFH